MAIRTLAPTVYDSRGYTNETALAALGLTNPDKVNRVITRLFGSDNDKFPLTYLTEGQGNIAVEEINDVEYYYNVIGRMKYTDEVVKYDMSITKPGLNGTPFVVFFKTNWFITQYGLIAPDGETQVRIMEKPVRQSDGSYKYVLQLKGNNPAAYCALTNLATGKHWTLTAPTVSESFSRGNTSNVMAPGRMTNQISIHRYSKKIGGNIANKVIPIVFDGNDTTDGKPVNLWINEEMKQFEVWMRQMNEESLWYSTYNRAEDGTIIMKDYDNGEPIPEGAGIIEMVKANNYDTYGYDLTVTKLKNTITDVFYSDTDTGKMEVVLYCGSGFARDFDEALQNESQNKIFQQALGDKVLGSTNGGLTYGNYFTQYRTIEGHTVTLKQCNMFDFGSIAEMDKKNGNIHPRTGLPMSSHKAIFLDMSVYDGERNIKMYKQKGRGEISTIIKGLAPVPPSWGAVPIGSSTDEDAASYEKLFTRGININNATRCFMLESKL